MPDIINHYNSYIRMTKEKKLWSIVILCLFGAAILASCALTLLLTKPIGPYIDLPEETPGKGDWLQVEKVSGDTLYMGYVR